MSDENLKNNDTKETNGKKLESKNAQETKVDNSKQKEASNEKQETKPKKKKSARRLLVLIAIILFALGATIVFRAQYLNIIEVGEQYASVFKTNAENTMRVAGVAFVISYIAVYISTKFIHKGLREFFEEEKKEMPKLPNKSISFVIGLVIAAISAVFLTDKYAVFANAAVFGQTDGVFGTDIGYYIFTLPFIQSIFIAVMLLVVGLAAYTAAYYIISFNVYFDGVSGETIKKSIFIKQLIVYLMMIVIIFAGYIIVNSQNILTGDMVAIQDEEETELAGAGLTDLTVKLWGYRILAIVIVFAVFRFLRQLKKKSFNQCVVSMAIVPVYLLAMFLVMLYVEYVYVGSNELDKEKEYIALNIGKTKEAYGIDISQIDISSYSSITYEQVEENEELIDNIPLISEDVTLAMVEEQQESTSGYYSYEKTQLAMYNRNLVYITPREILSDTGFSYNNRTLRYTHGYSIVATTATDNDSDGYAEYLISDYTETNEDINITEPRIYFGLETNSIIATNTDFGNEYDYPITATTYEENIYDGEAGLTLGFWDRLVLGISNKNLKLAFSSYINEDTKIITKRNILERVETILPDLTYDENPYLVITDEGRLVWVIDAYTTSNNYPYAQMTVLVDDETGAKEKINYIRNSIKVLVDAYDGTTTFYITDRTDPIAITYANMYSDLFSDEKIPSDISEHFVYSQYLYEIQANMVAMYHDVSEDTLYRGDDVWTITPTSSSTVSSSTLEPYYTVLKTQDQDDYELGLVVTYNKEKKQSITSYLVGTYRDGSAVLTLYKFSSNSNVAGIVGLSTEIEQDTTISSEMESLESSGVKLIKEMFIVPIDNTLLYVEPIYQVMLNEEEEIPVLKKVIVASGNTVAIGDTLDEAISNLFSDYAVDFEFTDTEDIDALVDAIIKANNNFNDSMNSNDLEMMGKDLEKLQTLINQLETAREKEIEEEEEEEATSETVVDGILDNIEKMLDSDEEESEEDEVVEIEVEQVDENVVVTNEVN